jgi:hypothetical protein
MKKAVLLFLFGLFVLSCSFDRPTSPMEMRLFEKIFEIQNTPKNELYIRANAWFVDTFNSAESVIQFQDKEAGKIMGKYKMYILVGQPVSLTVGVTSIITVDVKDNMARLRIEKLIIGDNGGDFSTDLEAMQHGREKWEMLAISLEQSLNKSNDW